MSSTVASRVARTNAGSSTIVATVARPSRMPTTSSSLSARSTTSSASPTTTNPDKSADKAKRLDRAKNKMDVLLAKQRMGAVGTKQFFSDIGSNVVADLATIF